MPGRITVCVPIHHAERFLAETLRSIAAQTSSDFDVLMSVDGPDPGSEAIAATFTADPRFRLVVQPQRLGWIGNFNWTMNHAEGEFCCFLHQQDLIPRATLATLVGHADANPEAALVYGDVEPLDLREGPAATAPSVLGSSPYMRVTTMLHDHFQPIALGGLVRREAVAGAGPMPDNPEPFGVEMAWLTAIARSGELHRVPERLFRQRVRNWNYAARWRDWSFERRIDAWCRHCLDMLDQALGVPTTAQEARILWLTTVERLTSLALYGPFFDSEEIMPEDGIGMVVRFLDLAEQPRIHDLRLLLDTTWAEARRWTRDFLWTPSRVPVRVVAFGPNPVVVGEAFNPQDDGLPALWLRASRRLAPTTRIRLAGRDLPTKVEGTLATATVPPRLIAAPGDLPLFLVGPEGMARSNAVVLQVLPGDKETAGPDMLEAAVVTSG